MKLSSIFTSLPPFTKAVWLALGLAVLLQIIPITWPVTQDEIFSWFCTITNLTDVTRISAGDVHPPLYFWLVNLWGRVAGNELSSLRMLSGLFGSVCAIAFLILVDRVLSIIGTDDKMRRRTLLFALLIFAFNASIIIASHWARMYSFMCMCATLNMLSIISIIRSERPLAAWIGFTASSIVLILTHYFGLIFVAGQFVFLLVETKSHGSSLLSRRLCTLISMGVCCLCFIPWISVIVAQSAQVSNEYWIPELSIDTISAAVISVFYPCNEIHLGLLESSVFIIIFASFLAVMLVSRKLLDRILFIQIIVHTVAIIVAWRILGRSILVSRFLACLLPLFLAWLAVSIGSIRISFIRRSCMVLIGLNILSGAILVGYMREFGLYKRWARSENYARDARELVKLVSQNSQSAIISTAPQANLWSNYFTSTDNVKIWFWNPELINRNRESHIEFLSCALPDRRLQNEDFRKWNEVWLLDARSGSAKIFPPGWSEDIAKSSVGFGAMIVHLVRTAEQ